MSETLKIVVPTDFSDASLAVMDWVRRLSERGHVQVHAISVVQEPMMYMPVMAGAAVGSMPTVGELEKITQANLDTFVEQHMSDFAEPPIATAVVGRPADAITEYANKIGAQMIVIATRGHSRLEHALLGSVAEGVVRHAECPVLTVRS